MAAPAVNLWLSDTNSNASQDSVDIHQSFGPSEDGSDHGGDISRKSSGVLLCHPYVHSTGAEVNIFNCVAIFMAYCKALLGEEFNRAQLFQFHRPVGQNVDQLHALRYPSPEGTMYVTAKQVDAAWGGKGLADIVHRRQIAGLRDIDRQKIHFVYPVVLDMIRRKFLDEYNKPSAAVHPTAPAATRLALPAVPPAAAPTQRPRARPGSRKEGSKWPQNKDPKSLLNELKHQMGIELLYETLPVWPQAEAPRFQSVLQVKWQQESYVFRGSPANSKKAAEQTAAVPAVDFILSGGLPTAPAPSPQRHPIAAPPPPPLPTPIPGPAVQFPSGTGPSERAGLAPRSPQSPPPEEPRALPIPLPGPSGPHHPPLHVPLWSTGNAGASARHDVGCFGSAQLHLASPCHKETPLAVSSPTGCTYCGEPFLYLMPAGRASSWPPWPPASAMDAVGDASVSRGPSATLTKGWQFTAAWLPAPNLFGPGPLAEHH